MEQLGYSAGGDRCEIRIGAGAIGQLGHLIGETLAPSRMLVVTDTNVAELHLDTAIGALGEARIEHQTAIVPSSMPVKSWQALEWLCDKIAFAGLHRGDAVVALGGGSIGDLAGLAASLHHRGCALVQVPTTLLAQVDSAIGGKTAIDTTAGRNMVGSFHHPRLVLVDPDLLATLDLRDRRAGYAEIVKYGCIGDADFFAWCEANGAAIIAGESDALVRAVTRSLAAKIAAISGDEADRSGQRALLNLGHSFAHALEAIVGDDETLRHGEAVACGLVLAFDCSVASGYCDAADAMRVRAHLAACGFELDPARLAPGCTADAMIAAIRGDKKSDARHINLVLVRGIGEAFLDHAVDQDRLARFLNARLA